MDHRTLRRTVIPSTSFVLIKNLNAQGDENMYIIIYYHWTEDDVWFGGSEGPFENGEEIKTHLEKQGYRLPGEQQTLNIEFTYWCNDNASDHRRNAKVTRIVKPPT